MATWLGAIPFGKTKEKDGKRMCGNVLAEEREAWQVVAQLEAAGHEAYLVGGCVRDRLLGREVFDYDIATSALPEEVQALFPHTLPIGIQHGTVRVLMDIDRYEVTTFRSEGKYEDARRPSEVTFVRRLEDDLARRDFTINAMALGSDGTLHDPFGGQVDLANKRIRAVGDPVQRFSEDALRMLRAIRFASQLQFSIEEKTLAAIALEAQELRHISRERIREEWHKMLLSSPSIALPLLRQTQVLRYVVSRPQVFDLHVYDPWGLGVDPWDLAGRWAELCPEDLPLRYGVVFLTVKMEPARINKTLQELKLSGQLKREIKTMLAVYELGDPKRWSDLQWRQLLFQHGREAVLRACMLHAAMRQETLAGAFAEAIEKRVLLQPLWNLQDLQVTGADLIAAGVEEGPAVGRMLNRLAQWVLEDPARNDKTTLLAQVSAWRTE